MSEKVELLRVSVDALNRGDRTAWLSTFDPDGVMIPAHEWPERAPVRGAAAVWDFYAGVIATWEAGSFELGEIIEVSEDTLVLNVRRETRGRASGAGVAFDYWNVTKFRRKRVIQAEWFPERAEALEAVERSA